MTSKQYLSQVRRRLTCSSASRRRLLNQAERMAEDFLQENPGADGDALAAAFGASEEFARQMLDTLEPGEVAAAQKRRKLAKRGSIALAALALVVTAVVCLVKCLQMQEVVNGDFLIVETTRELTKEEFDASLVVAAGQEAVGNVARWTEETLCETINGLLSVDEVKTVIDSIGH